MLRRILSNIYLIYSLSVLSLLCIMAVALVRSESQEIHGVEQNVIYSLQLLRANRELYSHPEEAPYNVVQYSPAYYALVDTLANLLGIQAEDVMGIYVVGRASSFVFGLGIAALIAICCVKFGLNGKMVLGAFILALLLPMPWHLLARPDAMMIFVLFLALVLFMVYLRRPDTALLLGIGIALAFGVLIKQTAVLYLLFLLAFPFFHHAIKDRLLLLFGWFIGLVIGSILFSRYFSIWPAADNFFYLNVIDGVKNGINLLLANQMVYEIYFTRFRPFFLLPLILTVYVLVDLLKESELAKGFSAKLKAFWTCFSQMDRTALFLLYIFWAVSLSALLLSVKDGSAINYMNESMLLSILLLAYYIGKRPIEMLWLDKLAGQVVLGLIFITVSLSILVNFVMMHGADVVRQSPVEDWEATFGILESELQEHPDSYFIYFPRDKFDRWLNLYFYENSIFTPREVYDLSFFDLSTLQTYLDNGRLRLFITDKRVFPEEVFGYTNFDEYFELYRETDTHLIYLNRNSE